MRIEIKSSELDALDIANIHGARVYIELHLNPQLTESIRIVADVSELGTGELDGHMHLSAEISEVATHMEPEPSKVDQLDAIAAMTQEMGGYPELDKPT